MKMQESIQQFNQSLNYWIRELDQYEDAQLLLKPESDSWSLAQVYHHLIEETNFYIQQIEQCLSSQNYTSESMSAQAKEWFRNNKFPDKRFKGPTDLVDPANSIDRKDIKEKISELKKVINNIGQRIGISSESGKTKHPGHGYFNATEWLQYAEMHARHHLRQKSRIDLFLSNDKVE